MGGSIWDFVGAACWTPIAVLFWCDAARNSFSEEHAGGAIVLILATTAGASYCIGRLLGL